MQIKQLAAIAATTAVASAATSICDKYTTALLKQNTGANQYTLLSLLVNTAVIGNFTGPGTSNSALPGSMVAVPGIVAADGPLVKYFDGSLKSTNMNGKAISQNFLDGGGATPIIASPTSPGKAGSNQAMLLTHLYEFFGALLGCSQYGMSGFSSYAGDPNMASVHQFMDIDETEFTYFVQQIGLAAASFGVSKSDITTVANALTTTFGMKCSAPAKVLPGVAALPQAICVASGCPTASAPACSAYTMVAEPVAASSMAATPAASTPAASTPAATGAPAPISQISDGQPQATSPVAPLYTGAAAGAAVPGALAGIAGIAALVL